MFFAQPYRDVFTGGPENRSRSLALTPRHSSRSLNYAPDPDGPQRLRMSNDQPSILIVGAGAVGALFGSALARAGAQVAVVVRSDYEAVKRDGYDIKSPMLGNHRFRPHTVYRDVAACTEPPDYLILTTKVLAHVDRAALIRPAVGPRTVIVLI